MARLIPLFLLWVIMSNHLSASRSLKIDQSLEQDQKNPKSLKNDRKNGLALEKIRKERREKGALRKEVKELRRQEKEERQEFNRKRVLNIPLYTKPSFDYIK